MQDARKSALKCLNEIRQKGKKPKDAIEAVAGGLDDRDRAFLMEVLYGALRYRDTLDWIFTKYLKKKKPALDDKTKDVLRVALYQIFFMRVPEWAAVDEAVKMERNKKGLVNAVLRNVLRDRDSLEKEMDDMRATILNPSVAGDLKTKCLSAIASYPEWMIKRWANRFGFEEAFSLAAAGNKAPPLTLRVNTLRARREEILERIKQKGLDEARLTLHSPDGIKLDGTGSFRELGEFKGLLYIQDEAAQLISYMLGPKPGERILDACAAPGGKTTHIAQIMKDTGEIIAVDNDGERLEILRSNAAVLGMSSIKAIKADVMSLNKDIGTFDRILLDAPCSALGVIRRNPDIKHKRRPGDLSKFRDKHIRMLKSVSAFLKPGGTLVFCTCSTEPEEGEDVIREFLKTSENFHIIEDMRSFGDLIAGGFLRTYPHRDDMDGFFGAKMKSDE